MPITLPSFSRRTFLSGTAAAGLGLILSRSSFAVGESDQHRFFLLSDTHIAADPKTLRGTVNMFDNLKQVCAELLATNVTPASVLLNGDGVFLTGQEADYVTLTESLKPLRQAGMTLHLTLGNHDDRAHFWDAIKAEKDAGTEPGKAVENRYSTVVESARANWFILDSLDKTNSTPGLVTQPQIDWLAKELDARPDKPALVMVHHNPVFKNPNAAPKSNEKIPGIIDTEALWTALAPRKHVKALLFGHTHNWSLTKRDGIHLINLPTVAYAFAAGKPTGWVDCKLAEKGMELTLNCIDKNHKQNGEKQNLVWR